MKAAAKAEKELLIIQFGYDTALRVSELANLRCGDVDLSEGYIIVAGKGECQDTFLFLKKQSNYLKKG